MTCGTFKKGAAERLDWLIDYSDWMIDGDTITSAETPIGLDITAEPVIEDDKVRLWLSGGDSGKSYKVPLKLTTEQGRQRTECLKVRVR